MKIGDIKKPTLDKFRQDFVSLVKQALSKDVDPYDNWTEVGDSEIRARIVKDFIRMLEERYSFEIVLKSSLNDREGSVEGVVGELYHVFSTMFLVEVINSKIRSGQKNVEI